MNNVLVFDTETTGLPSNATPPYITQLCMMEYCMDKKIVNKMFSNYITLPEGVVIPEFITDITKITQDMCSNTGTTAVQMLVAFTEAYLRSDTIVSHNIDFDRYMIITEMYRYRNELKIICPNFKYVFNTQYENDNHIITYCTMKNGTSLCNIRMTNKFSEKKNRIIVRNYRKAPKSPKLEELYKFIFGVDIKFAHNAVPDTLNCLKCFIKMVPYRGKCASDFEVVFMLDSEDTTKDTEEAELIFEYSSHETKVEEDVVLPRRSLRIQLQNLRL